ncbi:outer membrane protein [Methylocapsa aurea]|uniref:outer membrane protein n=1 Tax=Methylocapsa aurea TaxID=663610 RepID=UPI0005615CD8|nr:outer membrane beta-barrel protein [Methylocapsa aurea]
MNQAFLRRLIASLAGICLTAGATALAADLPLRAPEPLPPPPAFTWTGAYFGVQVGGGWGQTTINTVPYAPAFFALSETFQSSGVFGGIHLGYNIQTGPLVLGLQAEYNFSGITGNDALYPFASATNSIRQFGSVDARVGFTFDRLLVYAIGGFAYADIRHSLQTGSPSPRYFISSAPGWDVGAGLEYALTDNWTARAEYRYYNWGTKSFYDAAYGPLPVLFGTTVPNHTAKETLQTARIGLTYKFGGPAAPVVARY